jgi:mRNA-degrading endonuclease toxin of MazEF toxin-antitoxin module
MILATGTVILAELPTKTPAGHEQTGKRPCIVLTDTALIEKLAFPNLFIAPMTGNHLPPHRLRVFLAAGSGGIQFDSIVLLDQVCVIDVHRVRARLGQLSATDLLVLQPGLQAMFGHLV